MEFGCSFLFVLAVVVPAIAVVLAVLIPAIANNTFFFFLLVSI